MARVVEILVSTFDGKVRPILISEDTSLEIMNQRGEMVAFISLSPRQPEEREVELLPVGKRVVEI